MRIPILLLLSAAAALALERPNIVIFLADDLGWNNVGYHGSQIATPNIDRLSREGMQLDKFYVYPVCSPTRAGFMTGRSSMRTGVMYTVIRPWSSYGLPTDEHILPQTFKAAGYQTAILGKWHLGHARAEFLPNARGWDHYYGHVNGAIDYYTHEREGGIDWQRNGKTAVEEGYTTELFAAEGARVLAARDRSKPILLYMPFNAPHAPLQAPKRLVDKYAAIKDPKRRSYAAMVDALDTAIGGVLAALDKEGMSKDTLVLFFSDNGGPLGSGADNTPLRNGKATTFEGGIRVPAIARWPGRIAPGKTDQVMTNLDLLPTLAAAAGIEPKNTKPLDGKNMWPAIAEGRRSPREDLFWAVEGNGVVKLAVRHEGWKLVREEPAAGGAAKNYLFRIDEDPEEKNDLAARNPEVTSGLAARIAKWRESHPPNGVRESDGVPAGWKGPKQWAEAARR
jgi:arylsulfatase A-like enzyme